MKWTYSEGDPLIRIGDHVLVDLCAFEDDRAMNEAGRVIAAAPELLEALKPFAHLAKVMEPGDFLHHRGVCVSYEQAKAAEAAVAKAKGESDD